jgi:hypothetical protein
MAVFTKLGEVKSLKGYNKQIKAQLDRLNENPKKFVYFEKFEFDEKEAPLLLLVDGVDADVLESVKKMAATPAQGRCKRVDTKKEDPKSTAGEVLSFEKVSGPDVKHASLSKLLKAASVPELARLADGAHDGDALRGKALGDKFADEDKKQGWRSSDPVQKENDKVTTRYADDKERDASRIQVGKDGLLRDARGKAVSNDLYKPKDGFVMDPKQGNLHTFRPGETLKRDDKTQFTHHSTPLAGKPVAGAGHLKADDGRITEIHDDSGHYKPSADFTLQVVEQLEALGASMLDESAVDAKGNPPGPEQRKKYKDLKERADKLQQVYDAVCKKLGDKFDPKNPPKELVQAREGIQKAVGELRDLGFAPRNKPAIVQLQGKTGLTAEEFAKVKGNLNAINALLLTKTKRPNVLDTKVESSVLNSLEALNLKIGEALAVRLTTQQFKQTGGNEEAIRAKADAMELIRKKGQTPEHKPDAQAGKVIEGERQKAEQRQKAAQPKTIEDEIDELGGHDKTVALGIPEKHMSWLSPSDQLAFLKKEISLEEALERSQPED